jgi:hypothetical protein
MRGAADPAAGEVRRGFMVWRWLIIRHMGVVRLTKGVVRLTERVVRLTERVVRLVKGVVRVAAP